MRTVLVCALILGVVWGAKAIDKRDKPLPEGVTPGNNATINENCDIFFEDFESGIPADWTIVDANGDGVSWMAGTTGDLGGYVPPNYGTQYAYYSDDDAGSSAPPSNPEGLISPVIDISGHSEIELVYSIGYNHLSSDWVEVYVSFDGGDWILLATYTEDISTIEIFNLTDYLPASTMQVKFEYWEEGGWNWAVGVDNVCVQTPPAPPPPTQMILVYDFDFNVSDQGFFSLNPPNDPNACPDGTNDWEWGTPSYGVEPGEPTCDEVPLTSCWATNLDGDYSVKSSSRLVSPPVTLPDTCDVAVILEICHWYDIESNYDGGNVVVFAEPDAYDAAPTEILTPVDGNLYGGTINIAPSYFACLVDEEEGFTSHLASWVQSYFDLSQYAGATIRFAFDFGSDESIVYPGWYIKWARIWCLKYVGVDESGSLIHTGLIALKPNPAKDFVDITFALGKRELVNLSVYDVTGRLVKTIARGYMGEGTHTVRWDGKDSSGRTVSHGIYFVKLTAGKTTFTEKVVLIK